MKKIISLIIFVLLGQSALASQIDKTITQSGINRSSISISIKDVSTGKTVYAHNDKKPTMPASTLKLLTTAASVDSLGENYEFKTELYKSSNNDLYLKLGGDPYFTTSNLNSLFKEAKSKQIFEPKSVYIDDFVLDSIEWGEGWQWDDDLNPLMPKFCSYNIDKNLLNIVVSPTSSGAPAHIYTTKFYPITFMNLVTTGKDNDIKISRNNNISPDILTINGTIKKQTTEQVPMNNVKRYFILRLEESAKEVEYYGKFPQKKTPSSNVYLVSNVNHSMDKAIYDILQNSNNFVAETVFKIAGGNFVNNTGSLKNSQKMLQNYFEKINLNADDVKIVDGSGVSKNNLVTSDFMSEFLVKSYNIEWFVNSLPTAGEGTLKNRMLYFKGNLKAKTGTLSDVSAIAGYITSRHGKTYAFDIMINDGRTKTCDKKSLEEYIIRDIYANY